jgi:hypothetical protein
MANPAGDSDDGVLRLDFDRRLKLQFCGSVVTSDAGLIAYRELDNTLGLSAIAGESLADARTGKNGRIATKVYCALLDADVPAQKRGPYKKVATP